MDEIGKDFLTNSYSPILTGIGDLNGDNKDDIIVVDNGIKANARIYLNGMKSDGLRILGLKDIGQLSFLSKSSVNFDYDGGDEIFFASKQFGLHYIFVESIGMVNQAVTVKTELLIDDINIKITPKYLTKDKFSLKNNSPITGTSIVWIR